MTTWLIRERPAALDEKLGYDFRNMRHALDPAFDGPCAGAGA